METIGSLTRLDPRTLWKSESSDFTPWLKDNIDQLSKILGMDISIIEAESNVGEFRADLYGKDISTGEVVVIENQLERTDHNHLGQLLTYAAGKEASCVVWISREVRSEHREVIDWLNEVTLENISFFAVEVEILKIDTSKPAINFKLVAYPNEWKKEVKGKGEMTDKARAYLDFFTDLLDQIKKKYPGVTNRRIPTKDSWMGLPSGKSGFFYSIAFASKNRFRVELYIDLGDLERNKEVFDDLGKQTGVIEKELGYPLTWERLDNRRACRISVVRQGSVEADAKMLSELQEWALQRFADFRRVFGKRIRE